MSYCMCQRIYLVTFRYSRMLNIAYHAFQWNNCNKLIEILGTLLFEK